MKKTFVILSLFVAVSVSSIASQAADTVFINDLGLLRYSPSNVSIKTSNSNVNTNAISSNFVDVGGVSNSMNNRLIREATMQKAEESPRYVEDEDKTVPASSKSEYGFSKGDVDTSSYYSDEINYSGVNASKTIYTDDLGRLHFFGKGNLVKD